MIKVVDLFAGFGGTSTGIIKAISERMRRPYELTAINHWRTALDSHSLNHPDVRHICESVENIHPREVVKSGHLHQLAASCECTFFSLARGGGPCNEQSRSQAWQIVRWATDIEIDSILMENVREFMSWGPINRRTKRPIASRKGEFFKAFINALLNIGYKVEFRIQKASDFGDPTSRKRFILIARKNKPVVWPDPSHGPGCSSPYRTARECIDFSLRGVSIFERHKFGLPPLRPNTIKRIGAGLTKFLGPQAEPFLAILNGSSESHIMSSARSLNEPMPAIVASGNHVMLCEPFLQHCTHHGNDAARSHSLSIPMPTVTGAKRGEFRLVEPEIIIQTDQSSGKGFSHTLDDPFRSIVSKQNMLLVQMLVKYYKSGRCHHLDKPFDTITTKPRFMLVEAEGNPRIAEFDLRTRMVQPHELKRAHSFPSDYQILGTKEEQTKQIGNSVPVELAAAHAHAALS
jgi:DNA (cytosine-5)-methyltransferase 1